MLFLALCLADRFILKSRRKQNENENALSQNLWALEDFDENEEEISDSADPQSMTIRWKELFQFLTKKSTSDNLPAEEEISEDKTDDNDDNKGDI